MDNKQKCISIIAILLALLAYSTSVSVSSTNNYFNNSTCTNCSNFSDNTKVNKSGDIWTGAMYHSLTNYNQINLSDNLDQIIINSQNIFSGNVGEIGIYPDQLDFNVGDGVNNQMIFDKDGLKIIGNGINSLGGLNMTENDILHPYRIGGLETKTVYTLYNYTTPRIVSIARMDDDNYSSIEQHSDYIDITTYSNLVPQSELYLNGGLEFYRFGIKKFNITSDVGFNTTVDMNSNNIINCGNCDSYSKLVNRSYNSTGAVFTGTTTIPHDDTVPTSTEGFNILNITITPKSQNNYIKICAQTIFSTNVATPNIIASFIVYNGTTLGISNAYSPAQYYEINTGVCAVTKANTTSPILIQSRAGSNAAGTITINGANGARLYGGTYNTYLIVDEYKD